VQILNSKFQILLKIRLQNLRPADTRRNWCVLLAAPILWLLAVWAAAEFLMIEKPFSQTDAIVVFGGGSTFIERAEKAAEI
jgi:uncharacterized SAM-binding protein YcdF (DUF218 family)